MLLGLWAFTGWQPVACAVVQTGAMVMKSSEIILTRFLLLGRQRLESTTVGAFTHGELRTKILTKGVTRN